MTITDQSTHGSTRCVTFTTSNDVEVVFCRSHRGDITIFYNPTRRSLGQTFWSADEMMSHYKSIRPELLECMRLTSE